MTLPTLRAARIVDRRGVAAGEFAADHLGTVPWLSVVLLGQQSLKLEGTGQRTLYKSYVERNAVPPLTRIYK